MGARMDHRGRTFALRSLLLATALSFAGAEPSWSKVTAVPGMLYPETPPAPTVLADQVNEFVTAMICPTCLVVTSEGQYIDHVAQAFVAVISANHGSAITDLLGITKQLRSGVIEAKTAEISALLASINELLNGASAQTGPPSWDAATINGASLSEAPWFGPWSGIVARAQTLGVEPIALLEYFAMNELSNLYLLFLYPRSTNKHKPIRGFGTIGRNVARCRRRLQ